jgi:hypothetical protein
VHTVRLLRTRTIMISVAFVALVAGRRPWAAQDPAAQAPARGLSPAQIEVALAEGAKHKGDEMGLRLSDSGKNVLNAMSGPNGGTTTGFSLEVYTPVTWVRQQAADAAKEYRVLAESDITDEIVAPVLRLVIHPDVPVRLNKSNVNVSSSVQHVVIKTLTRQNVIQPTNKDAFDASVSNFVGGTAGYNGLTATFALADLQAVGIVPGQTGFFITIVGSAPKSEREFEIKEKHFERLK